ncbi:MAG: hypothetical protein RBU24_09990, partial [Kiritimatiellia bacterium]|nr:hypothetical protein [Kiritimatiellia bacterium]
DSGSWNFSRLNNGANSRHRELNPGGLKVEKASGGTDRGLWANRRRLTEEKSRDMAAWTHVPHGQ